MGKDKKNNRRDFLSKLGAVAVGSTLLGVVGSKFANASNYDTDIEIRNFKGSIEDLLSGDYTNIKLKMQDDVRRAMQKPVKDRRWGMVIDMRKCIGCNACTVACIAENALPPGVVYRPVIKKEIGTYPNVRKQNMPKPCMQCDNPPCIKVCPVGATYKRDDGIVVIDYDRCIGCRYCITACPYGHRMFDFGEYYTEGTPELMAYEKRPSFEYGKDWERKKGKSPIGNTRKCTYCSHRLENGMLPQCVSTCIGGANYFGDLNDTESVVSKIADNLNRFVLKGELGTLPKTTYLL